MNHLLTAALALQYGQEAAERGLEFRPMYDTRLDELLTVAVNDSDRAENNALIRSWQTGYSDYCRSLGLGGHGAHVVIMADHSVLRGTAPTAGLVYWDWMDNLSLCAAFCEAEAGHWSLFQEETYLQRHWNLQEEYAKICGIFRTSSEPFIVALRRLMANEKQVDLSAPPAQPSLICESPGLTDSTRHKGLQYWSNVQDLTVLAVCAEWKACNLTLYQISCYSARHPKQTEEFNKIYNKKMFE